MKGNMRNLILPGVAGIAAAASCASTGASTEARAEQGALAPPPIQEFLARYENGRLCEASQEHEIIPVPQTDANTITTRLCAPVFPDTLQSRGFEAACIVRFRIDAQGEAVSPAAECSVVSDGPLAGDWQAFAAAAFPRLAEMSVSQSRYASPPENPPKILYMRRIVFQLRP